MIYKEEVRDLFSVEGYCFAQCISADFALGKGIALEFNKRFDIKNRLKKAYPQYLYAYRNGMGAGVYGDCLLENNVLNLVTKEVGFGKPTLSSMRQALERTRACCDENNIMRIAMPTIGAGLDGLNWADVSALIQEVFADTNIEILVCKLK